MQSTLEEAIAQIKSNQNIFIHSAAAAPHSLINAMSKRHAELKNVSIYQIHTEGTAPYALPEMEDAFTVKAFFVGANCRDAIQHRSSSYIPIFLSEIGTLFRSKTIALDVALISVSPPDKHGYCSLGPSVDISLAAVMSAKVVIAQVNNCVPRTHGDGLIHSSKIHLQVRIDEALPTINYSELSATHLAIGKNIAELVEDGATLQMGVGALPNAVLQCLEHHKDLGIHTEMFSDGILPLVEKGVITGSKKKKHEGMIISSFVMGSKKIYDFIDDNPQVNLLESSYVNDVSVIQQNPKVTAINSAVEIDITGQVCADSIGSKIISGVGGQMDFMRGASLSKGGKPIIAMSSTTQNGDSKIVAFLKQGAGVVTTRAHVHYIVTEYGVANLYGRTIEERVRLLIDIAHPKHREQLDIDSRLVLG